MYAQEPCGSSRKTASATTARECVSKPFALIIKSRDGKNTKTITSDGAVIDLNEPLSFSTNADGEPLKIKHAHLEPNVQIRDDKSTPDNSR